MPNRLCRAPALAALAACLAAASCIDGDERITLRRDGSGHAALTYQLPTAAVAAHGGRERLRQALAGWLGGDGIRLEALELTGHADRTRVHAELSFPSALALVDLVSRERLEHLPAPARHLAGTLDFRRRGRHVELTRTVRPRAALGGSLLPVPRSRLAGHRLVYQVTLPAPAAAHNATATRDGGRTLVWEYPLDRACATPPVIRLAAAMPLPRRLWLWAAAAIAAPVAAVVAALLARAVLHRRMAGR